MNDFFSCPCLLEGAGPFSILFIYSCEPIIMRFLSQSNEDCISPSLANYHLAFVDKSVGTHHHDQHSNGTWSAPPSPPRALHP